MMGEQPGQTENTISGGIFHGPALQGHGIQATFELPAAAPVALAQLPAATPGFTGRDDELAILAGLLDPSGTPGPVVVSAMAGLAGIGKTTLAVEAGHIARKQGWFGGGVLFVDLHGYDEAPIEPSQALDALLRALAVPAAHIPPTVEGRAGLYRSILAQISDPVLVIADNASSEAQVKPLLPGTGPHKVLVTSRYTLAGLDARLVDVTVLDAEAAVDLLDAALRLARPDDDRISNDRPAARQLAETCGGLPLALQITAALLKGDPTLGTGELAEELAVESSRLERLAYDDGSDHGASSVRTAFDLSYRRLDDTSARLFRLLSVNPGPDVRTASAAVLADLPVTRVRRILAGLARAHLIESAPDASGRWRMHDLARLFARQLSNEDANGREQACDRLLAYYLTMADAADNHLRALPDMPAPADFSGPNDALDWLDAERLNLVAAVNMAADTGRYEIALRLPLVMATYFDWRRRFDDLLATTTISLSAARRLGDRHSEGMALNNLGGALREVGRFEEAISTCQEARTAFQEVGDRQREGMALNNLGLALRKAGRFDEAITAHQEDLAICREISDRHGEGNSLTNLGAAMQLSGRLQEAITAQQEATAILRETGDRHAEGAALNNLGNALQKAERFDEAITAHQDAAVIHQETGDRHREGLTLNNLGLALRNAGRFDEAIAAHQDAATIFREIGDRNREDSALENLQKAQAAQQT